MIRLHSSYEAGKLRGFAQPDIRPIGERKYFLVTPYTYTLSNGKSYVVPAGFETDGASVPRIAWSSGVRPDGLIRAAAVVHDYLCVRKGQVSPSCRVSSREAADIFKDLMVAAGMRAKFVRRAYWAVRWFGPRWK